MPRFRTLLPLLAVVAFASILGPAPEVSAGEDSTCYRRYWPNSHEVEINVCEYTNGSSGYTELINKTDSEMAVCWTLEYKDGSTADGCNSGLDAGAKVSASCYSCNRKSKAGGVDDVKWRKVERVTN